MTHVALQGRDRLLEGLPVVERRLDLAGISTPILEGGQGPPLVLLHGPGEHALKWLRVLPDLVRRHRVVAPDLPGHGASTVTHGTLVRSAWSAGWASCWRKPVRHRPRSSVT
jgi:pimeloyl-ACP methyl ester carboxylesterase